MQAATINSEGLAFQHKEFIAKLATARHLPLSVWFRETLEAGALMSYGPNQVAICRRAAVFVDKIVKGANPAELPVEEPTIESSSTLRPPRRWEYPSRLCCSRPPTR